MKKKNYLLMFVLLAGSAFTTTKAQTTYGSIFTNWESTYQIETILNLFKEAGNRPLTDDELAKLPDWQFKQSRVPLRNVILSKEGQLDPSLDPKRNVFYNVPIGSTKIFSSMPSTSFGEDAFSLWPYIKIHGNWSTGWFGAAGNFMDVAHKHGTVGLSGLVFFDTTGGGTAEGMTDLRTLLTTKENGKFIYVEPLLNALAFFGHDGVNFNDEAHMYNNDLGEFFADLIVRAKERNQPFYLGWYGSASFNSGNIPAYFTESGRVASNLYMLNYGSTQNTNTTETQAKSLVGQGKITNDDIYNIYSGKWIVGLGRTDGYGSSFQGIENASQVGTSPWGEHASSRVFSYTEGSSLKEYSENYQLRQEMFFSGGKRNLAAGKDGLLLETAIGGMSMQTLKEFVGLGAYHPERSSVIGNLPFGTTFCLGNGASFYNCGEKMYGNWYNLASQDIQPTYRWLILKGNQNTVSKDIDASYTYDDAWIGGSSLKLKGNAVAQGTDIHLYRTDLTIGSGAKALVTFKVKDIAKDQESNLFLVLKKTATAAWDEYPLGTIKGNNYNGWTTTTIDLSAYGNKIGAIGLRVKGNKSNYEALVGELKLYDSTVKAVEDPINFNVEVVRATETTTKFTTKLTWAMARPAGSVNPIVYNEDVNVDHFEIFLKRGEYRKKMIATTSQWGTVLTDIDAIDESEEMQWGIRAVSADLKTKSNIVWMDADRNEFADTGSAKDPYCAAGMHPSEGDVVKARAQRWLKELKIEGAVKNTTIIGEGPLGVLSNYKLYSEDGFTVDPGSTFTLSWEANGYKGAGIASATTADGLQMCRAYVYCDWNKDYSFDSNDCAGHEENLWYGQKGAYDPALIKTDEFGERVVAFGRALEGAGSSLRYEVMKKSFTIHVPKNIKSGPTRMRIVFDDAWFPHVGACNNQVKKGLIIDIPMIVSGDIEDGGGSEIEEPVVGDKDLQSDSYTPADGSIVVPIGTDKADNGKSKFYPSITSGEIQFNFVDRVEILSLQGSIVAQKNGGEVYRMNLTNLASGTYIVKMYNGDAVTIGKLIKK